MSDKNSSWDKLFSHKQQELLFGPAKIVVEDGVFTPDPSLTYSATMVIDNLPPVEGLRVADVGTGSGVLAVVVALRGAREVVATDVSGDAVKNAIANSVLNNVSDKIKIIKTNLFDNIQGSFDVILANLPILGELWQARGVSVEPTIESFLREAKSFLNPGGKIYLPWASFGDKSYLESLIKKYGYNYYFQTAEKLGYVWYLYVLSNTN